MFRVLKSHDMVVVPNYGQNVIKEEKVSLRQQTHRSQTDVELSAGNSIK